MIKSIKKFVYLALILVAVLCLAVGVSFSLTTKTAYADEKIEYALNNGEVGVAYNATLRTESHDEGDTYELFECLLFEGLTLSADGTISGTPLEGGSAKLIVLTLDTEGYEIEEKNYTLTVKTKEANAVYTQNGNLTRKMYNNDGTLKEEITEEIAYNSYYDGSGRVFINEQATEDMESGEINSNIQTIVYDQKNNPLTEINSTYQNGYIVARNRYDYEYDSDNRVTKYTDIQASYYDSFFQSHKSIVISEYVGDTVKNSFTMCKMNDEGHFEEDYNYFDEKTTTKTDTEINTVYLRYTSAAKTEDDLEHKEITVETETESKQEVWDKSSDGILYTLNEKTILSDTLQKSVKTHHAVEADWIQTQHTVTKTEVIYREILIREKDVNVIQIRYYVSGKPVSIDSNRMERTYDKDTVTEISSSYRNDVIRNEYVRFYKEGALVINDEATLLSYLKKENLWENNYYDNVNLKEGVNVTLTESLIVPGGINLTFNNLTVAENAELTIPEDSEIIISGKLVCGTTTVGTDLTYAADKIIKGTIEIPTVPYKFPAWAIALISVLSAVILIYLLGLLFYKRKIIKWKFLKYLYGYVKFTNPEAALSPEDVATTEIKATEPKITAENPSQVSTPESPTPEDKDSN